LDWVFRHVEDAIVLEDDCLPDVSFFRFCSELLAKYRDTDQIKAICGTDLLSGEAERDESYRFSRYPVIWGWATWRRAWQSYDSGLRSFPTALETKWLGAYLGDARTAEYWTSLFQREYMADEIWDYAWTFSVWQSNGLSIHSSMNLVSNIGFGAEASHTLSAASELANLPVHQMEFPLRHPEAIVRDEAADTLIEEKVFSGKMRQALLRARQAMLDHRRKEQTSAP
jgi:hypothetical protein